MSVQVAVAGAAVGGAAWALSLSWSESVGLLAPPPTAHLISASGEGTAKDDGLLFYLPLLHIPFP